MKLIVSCFSCSPSRGSEPGVGWNYLMACAAKHEVWALVDGWEFGEELRQYQADHPDEMRNVHFVFVPCPPHPLLRKLWPPSYYWFYNRWHRKAYKIACALHEKEHFDAAWKASMVTFREPGYLWKLPIPFVWGPVGALGYTSLRLTGLLGVRGGAQYVVRNIINWCHAHFKRRSALAARKAASFGALIAATGENRSEMKKLWGVEASVMSEVGIRGTIARGKKDEGSLRLVWSGQFTYGKALPILLQALDKIKDKLSNDWCLHVIGDGARAGAWKKQAEDLGLSKYITWHGWIKRAEALKIQQDCNVSVITSIRDLTSTVILESLACGNPVICLDHCGFSDVIDDSCGIKIAITDPHQIVDDFGKAILEFHDVNRRRVLSEGAYRKSEHYSWKNKQMRLLTIIEKAACNV